MDGADLSIDHLVLEDLVVASMIRSGIHFGDQTTPGAVVGVLHGDGVDQSTLADLFMCCLVEKVEDASFRVLDQQEDQPTAEQG